MSDNRIRCLLGMLGTDVHSKGIRTLAKLLRDQGIEVIYLGEHNTVEGFTNAMVAEDVDVVGLSFSTSTYIHYTDQLLAKMRELKLDDIPLMLGGLIHPDDELSLRDLGVKGIFGPGSSTADIVAFLESISGKAAQPVSSGND